MKKTKFLGQFIGGHSRYFNEFDNDTKMKFIERFKVEEGAFS